MRGARREVSIVRGNVREIRARIRVISEAACEAARYCALLGKEGNSQRQGTDQARFSVPNGPRPTV